MYMNNPLMEPWKAIAQEEGGGPLIAEPLAVQSLSTSASKQETESQTHSQYGTHSLMDFEMKFNSFE